MAKECQESEPRLFAGRSVPARGTLMAYFQQPAWPGWPQHVCNLLTRIHILVAICFTFVSRGTDFVMFRVTFLTAGRLGSLGAHMLFSWYVIWCVISTCAMVCYFLARYVPIRSYGLSQS